MTQALPARRFWIALAAWSVATTAFTVAYTEATITPVADDATMAGAARVVAYVMAAFTIVGMVGLTMGSAFVMSSTLRWIDIDADYRIVLATLWPAVAIMAAFAMGAAVLIWVSPVPAVAPGAPEDWERLRATMTSQFPFRHISFARPWVRGVAAGVVVVAIKRRLGCDWLDAGIGVGVPVALYLLLTVGPRLWL